LNPKEPVYYHNFGTTVFLFRKDAMEHYRINEQQVFDKALELYAQAIKHDPTDFPLATDVARTYYGIKPPRPEEALRSWTNALSLAPRRGRTRRRLCPFRAHQDARRPVCGSAGASERITNEMYTDLKKTLTRSLTEKEAEARATNAPPAKLD